MTISIQRNPVAVFLMGALVLLLGGCRRCRPAPPIPLCGQVVMRGHVDRPTDCWPAVSPTSVVPVVPVVKTTSFLADYEGETALKQNPWYPNSSIWVKPGIDLRAYDQLMIDEVQIVPGEGSDLASFTPELKARATKAFREIMVETIEPYYDIVDQPGENVLRVRLALTDIVAAGDGLSAKVGSAALEGELVDSRTGEKQLAFLDRVTGSDRGEIAEAQWRHAEGAFYEWAERLLDFLDHWEERAAEGP